MNFVIPFNYIQATVSPDQPLRKSYKETIIYQLPTSRIITITSLARAKLLEALVSRAHRLSRLFCMGTGP